MHVGSVVVDCNDFETMMAFWAAVLRCESRDPPDPDRVVLRDLSGTGVSVSLHPRDSLFCVIGTSLG